MKCYFSGDKQGKTDNRYILLKDGNTLQEMHGDTCWEMHC